AQRSPSLRLRF
uniref:Short neuropeptide F-1 n=2 Tax=Muscoidea TaxID=43754 RepID=SNPF1_DELRA|nr:RecName: Full=Short neuropeptide F-1; Short=sNPF-1; AltName: Full=RLRF-amide; Contains: RecName: Full=Short neuropeptide F-1(4-11); Short=sNPF-1(4-11); AltName: Full=RLRF-amide(4-11) [Delia radicum]